MQKIFAFTFFLIPFLVFGFVVPEKPTSFVSDFANILQTDQKVNLENKLLEIERQTTNEIAVVIIDSLDGDSIENVSQAIFDRWKIGKKGKDNGVLILLSINDRTMRIQTGYGVEGVLTDLQTKYIQDEVMAPAFRLGNYSVGISEAIDKIMLSLSGNDIVPNNYHKDNKYSNLSYIILIAALILFRLLSLMRPLFGVFFSRLSKSKSWWEGGVWGAVLATILVHWSGDSFISLPSLLVYLVAIIIGLALDYKFSKMGPKDKSSGGFWGGFGGGGGSGGFGGFGGGFSGGGGSSSRW